MKKLLSKLAIVTLFSTMLFSHAAFAVVEGDTGDGYTDDPSISITLTGELNTEGNAELSWDEYTEGDLEYYKVVHSTEVENPYYPLHSYVKAITDPAETSYTHTGVEIGVNYYRICVITTDDRRGCSNSVTLDSEQGGTETVEDTTVTTDTTDKPATGDPYTDDDSIEILLEGYYQNGKAFLSWDKYEGGDLKWYKVVHSTEVTDPYYPRDGYVQVYSNPADTTYEHSGIKEGANYYRVCVITDDDRRGCSNTIIIFGSAGDVTTFTDTDEHWAKDYIDDLAAKGVVEGNEGLYEPDKPIVRAEAMKMVLLGLNLGEKPCDPSIFPDLNSEDWFCGYAVMAFKKGIVEGSNGYLYPGKNITRAEAVKILLEAKGITPPEISENPFPDVSKDDWYAGYAYKAKVLGLVEGINGNFEGGKDITRAELAKIVSEAIK